jgi:hypothetical protein
VRQLGKSVRRGLLATVSAIALSAGAAVWLRSSRNRSARQQRVGVDPRDSSADEPTDRIDSSTLTRQFLLYYIMPVWLAVGRRLGLSPRYQH